MSTPTITSLVELVKAIKKNEVSMDQAQQIYQRINVYFPADKGPKDQLDKAYSIGNDNSWNDVKEKLIDGQHMLDNQELKRIANSLNDKAMDFYRHNAKALEELSDFSEEASFALYNVPQAKINDMKDPLDGKGANHTEVFEKQLSFKPFGPYFQNAEDASRIINSNVMIVGYNQSIMPTENKAPWSAFHRDERAANIAYSFENTMANGGYLTYLFKGIHFDDPKVINQFFQEIIVNEKTKEQINFGQDMSKHLTELGGYDDLKAKFESALSDFITEYNALRPELIVVLGDDAKDNLQWLVDNDQNFKFDEYVKVFYLDADMKQKNMNLKNAEAVRKEINDYEQKYLENY